MFSIDMKSSIPIFEQITQQVGKYIALGVLNPHDQLPTVRNLAKELGINPNTVSKAYHECEMTGMIYSVAGKGSFISEDIDSLTILKTNGYLELLHIVLGLQELGETKESILTYLKEHIS